MPRSPKKRSRPSESVPEKLVARMDGQSDGAADSDTITTGFASLDKVLGGGLRHRDLAILAGDVGSGKSALGLGMAIRAAATGVPTLYFSGEMSADRVMERALALEAKISVDDLRQGRLDEATRAAVRSAAIRLRDMPLLVKPLLGTDFDEVVSALDVVPRRRLLIIDSLQLTGAPRPVARLDERVALTVRALKALAVDQGLVVLALAQLPYHRASRPDPRPTLDDLGALGAIKQNADVIVMIYREEMYRPSQGVEGGAELILAKNRNGPTSLVDLYFYAKWLRFVDMLDVD